MKVFVVSDTVTFNFDQQSANVHRVEHQSFFSNTKADASNMPAKPLTHGINGVGALKVVASGVSTNAPNGL